MDILNNREIATGIWAIVFLIWAFTIKNVRALFRQIVEIFFSRFIIVSFILMAVYTLAMIAAIDSFGLWESHQIKNVIFWFFSAASYSFFQITKASDEPYYFSKAIKDNLKIIVVIQFVLSVYTFSLWVELIFIPLMVVIGGMIAVSQQKEEHKIVEQLLTKLTEAIGLFIVIFTVYKLITAFGELGQLKTIYDLIIPTALSLLLLPFLYLLAVFNNYQSIFVRLGLFIKDPQLLKYAKLTSIRKCHLRFAKLVRWANNVACLDIKSKADINSSFDNLFQQIKDEKNPPFIPLEQGWSPYIAKDYLIDLNLETGLYKNIYDDTWHASSRYLEIGTGILPNNIAYYIEGGRVSAKQLTLKLNVNEIDDLDKSHETFLELASTLFELAMGCVIPDDAYLALASGKSIEKNIGNQLLSISKTDWHKDGKYDYILKLQTM
ncbi:MULTISPECIES: hypothetical protein [Colwelliaceae]|uniref:Uncharacterized protein n=2 Tax=Colwelliaceae TaxID=267889 RepID=A0A7X0NEN1_9GAMM|nr:MULTISPECIES: hypothetical protein [Colwelliaceae]MBB6541973.1 hypothetical protein [Thalassotalea piscium]SEL87456.1 hypothetical protein SAMN05216262_12816 [Colwellia chukchiensis]